MKQNKTKWNKVKQGKTHIAMEEQTFRKIETGKLVLGYVIRNWAICTWKEKEDSNKYVDKMQI